MPTAVISKHYKMKPVLDNANLPGRDHSIHARNETSGNTVSSTVVDNDVITKSLSRAAPRAVSKKTFDVSDCFHESLGEIFGRQGVLKFSFTGLRTDTDFDSFCYFKVTVPEKYFLKVKFTRFNLPCETGRLVLKPGVSDCLEGYFCTHFEPHDVLLSTNSLYLELNLLTVIVDAHFTMHFSSSSERSHAEFGVHFTSNYSGYLTLPGYGQKVKTTNCVNATYSMPVPGNLNVVMISIWELVDNYCPEFSLKIYRREKEPLLFEHNSTSFTRFYILNVPVFFRFETSCQDYFSQYQAKLLFSFHSSSELPPTPNNRLVNCSTPLFSSFRQHLRCDLIMQCQDGEDERHCQHSSPDCDRHSLFNNTCYAYILPHNGETFNLTHNPCTLAGRTVASINNIWKFKAIQTIMRKSVVHRAVVVNITKTSLSLPLYYQHSIQNGDGSINYEFPVHGSDTGRQCLAVPPGKFYIELQIAYCKSFAYICEFHPTFSTTETSRPTPRQLETARLPVFQPSMLSLSSGHTKTDRAFTSLNGISLAAYKSNYMLHNSTISEPESSATLLLQCSEGYVIFNFLSCGSESGPGTMPEFTCDKGGSVPYTLVCDFYPDCPDSSDEEFCIQPPCGALRQCRKSKQCVFGGLRCDGRQNCRDRSDELNCYIYDVEHEGGEMLPPPFIIHFDGFGFFTKTPLTDGFPCPETHFLCPGSNCLPLFVMCNGVHDCPGKEDEMQCDRYVCPGFYRCRRSSVCLHPLHLCDDTFHCPYQDDELMCGATCPEGCYCQGLSAVCSQLFAVDRHTKLRYVDASDTHMSPVSFHENTFTIFLRLANCQIKSVGVLWLPNLHILDLSYNFITIIHTDTFVRLGNLRQLVLSGNPISLIRWNDTEMTQTNLWLVDLSNTQIHTFVSQPFVLFEKINCLNLSSNPLYTLSEDGMHFIPELKILDVRRTKLEYFQGDVFRGLNRLSKIYADNYKLCCKATLPEYFPPDSCLAPVDELSSCGDLLTSDVFRAFLWVLAVMAVAGNVGGVVFKTRFQKDSKGSGFNVFVVQLSVSDLCMGVYLVLIGSADLRYRGKYLWYDLAWRHSSLCQTAGFLSFLSAEVSAFIIFLITLDRFIVFKFPFSDIRFSSKSALIACGVAWLLGAILAGVPLLSVTSHWEYYSQTGICIPLPITRIDFAGRNYSFAVMIVLNLAVFLLIAAGQVSIYWSIHSNSMDATNSTQSTVRKSRDTAIVRRLSAVVVSDFLCWFPIGLLGVLSSVGVPIPGWLNVIVAILVLPINSAANPFLYTYNVLKETRRKIRKAEKQKILDKVLRNFKQQGEKDNSVTSASTIH